MGNKGEGEVMEEGDDEETVEEEGTGKRRSGRAVEARRRKALPTSPYSPSYYGHDPYYDEEAYQQEEEEEEEEEEEGDRRRRRDEGAKSRFQRSHSLSDTIDFPPHPSPSMPQGHFQSSFARSHTSVDPYAFEGRDEEAYGRRTAHHPSSSSSPRSPPSLSPTPLYSHISLLPWGRDEGYKGVTGQRPHLFLGYSDGLQVWRLPPTHGSSPSTVSSAGIGEVEEMVSLREGSGLFHVTSILPLSSPTLPKKGDEEEEALDHGPLVLLLAQKTKGPGATQEAMVYSLQYQRILRTLTLQGSMKGRDKRHMDEENQGEKESDIDQDEDEENDEEERDWSMSSPSATHISLTRHTIAVGYQGGGIALFSTNHSDYPQYGVIRDAAIMERDGDGGPIFGLGHRLLAYLSTHPSPILPTTKVPSGPVLPSGASSSPSSSSPSSSSHGQSQANGGGESKERSLAGGMGTLLPDHLRPPSSMKEVVSGVKVLGSMGYQTLSKWYKQGDLLGGSGREEEGSDHRHYSRSRREEREPRPTLEDEKGGGILGTVSIVDLWGGPPYQNFKVAKLGHI
ncbi:hypothetical protein BJ684DRAFT_22005 [Piptocephalis cylindrospora]|uniref:Uncharacterized protein n=1 Tax=Piptocephalis cylindrospora TaxID=1907219 RepID=A0A4P9XYG4_9FUNG|nr:hypothetical protein BJ684DRAFT_22005 [Piptocephalis cylindrospora]|eukprot:RKP11427.1 hypothetical protein BJ684DRAFT_22005 [Piptocephalis cylindrospora]